MQLLFEQLKKISEVIIIQTHVLKMQMKTIDTLKNFKNYTLLEF
jgi:hypothetical protein